MLPEKYSVLIDTREEAQEVFNEASKAPFILTTDDYKYIVKSSPKNSYCLRSHYEEAHGPLLTFKQWKEMKNKFEVGDEVECDFLQGSSSEATYKYLKRDNIKLGDKLVINRVEDSTSSELSLRFKGKFFFHPSSSFRLLEKMKIEDIIGYLAPEDLYGGEVKKGTIYIKCHNSAYYQPNGYKDINNIILPKEIVEQWCPVCKIIEKSIELGTPARKFTIRKEVIEVISQDHATYRFFIANVEELLKTFYEPTTVAGLVVKPTSLQIGCVYGTALTEEDLLTLKELYSEL